MKRILLFFIILTIGALLTLFYYMYGSYSTYNNARNLTSDVDLIQNLGDAVGKISKERFHTVLKQTKQKGFDDTKLKEFRYESDKTVKNALLPYKEYRDKIIERLDKIRVDVDNKTGRFGKTTAIDYSENISNILLEAMEKVSELEGVRDSIKYYVAFSKNLEYSNQEQAFIAYILGSKSTLDSNDFAYLKAITSENLEKIDNLPDIELKVKIKSMLDAVEYEKIGKKKRESIVSRAGSGHYIVSQAEWIETSSKKINKIKQIQQMALKETTRELSDAITTHKTMLMKYGMLTLGLLLLLALLLMGYFSKNRKKSGHNKKSDIHTIIYENEDYIESFSEEDKQKHLHSLEVATNQESDYFKSTILSNVSHDMRVPLNSIIGFAELIESADSIEEKEQFIEEIKESSRILLGVMDKATNAEKAKAYESEEKIFIPFDPIRIFESIVEPYGERAAQKNIELTFFVDPSLPKKLLGDPVKVSQVLLNLLDGIKFTKTMGEIDVHIEKVSETQREVAVKFLISDTGLTLTHSQKDAIYNKLLHTTKGLEEELEEEIEGIESGLVAAGRLIDGLNGKLEIESTREQSLTLSFVLILNKISEDRVEKLERKDVQVGYLSLDKNIKLPLEKNIKIYAEYTGASFIEYDENDLLQDNKILPDVLFVNNRYVMDEEILEKYMNLNTKVIFIVTQKTQNILDYLDTKPYKVLYEPINLSKVLESINSVDKKSILPMSMDEKKVKYIDVIENASPIKKLEFKKIDKIKNIHVLVAEDNHANQILIQKILEQYGLKVTVAEDGKKAVELYKQDTYDIVFMDIDMPVMGGVEATQKILEYENEHLDHHSPIIAFTANVIKGDKEKYMDAGMDNYLPKPIDFELLEDMLRKYFPGTVFERKQIIRENKKNSDSLLKTKETSIEYDVLLYRRNSMLIPVYFSTLKSLGYTIEVVYDKNELKNSIKDGTHKYVLFDEAPFGEASAFIVHAIKEKGAKPFIFVSEDLEKEYECETLNSILDVGELKSKLEN